MLYKNNMCNCEFRDLSAFDEFILGGGLPNFPTVSASFYVPASDDQGFQFFRTLTNACWF